MYYDCAVSAPRERMEGSRLSLRSKPGTALFCSSRTRFKQQKQICGLTLIPSIPKIMHVNIKTVVNRKRLAPGGAHCTTPGARAQ